MRLLYVADGRSPIALNWIAYFATSDHEVYLASTYPCRPQLNLATLRIFPILPWANGEAGGSNNARGFRRVLRMVPVRMRTVIRQMLGALMLPQTARELAQWIDRLQPDLVHAMRIPYEGALAATALQGNPRPPLLISVWGNDFTLHAASNPLVRRYTYRVLHRADALHTDCQRDQRLASQWGFPSDKPRIVLPGGGGVQLDLFYPPAGAWESLPPSVINPRGFRAYVNNYAFFKAIPSVLANHPRARFLCPAMLHEPQAHRWVERYGIASAVDLLPRQSREEMAALFRQAQVAVSPSRHDGTPNTLLEALACGCFPVAGDIESLHEWITPGLNGLLVNPDDAQALSQAICTALENPDLRLSARQINQQLVAERADYRQIMPAALAFYRQLIA